MKTATGLILIAIGAILAFAVTTNTSVFNLNVAGYVIMLVGLAGLFIPRRGYASISRRFITRRSRRGPDGTVVETREADLPPYVVRNPRAHSGQDGLPGHAFPSIPVDPAIQQTAMEPDSDIGGQVPAVIEREDVDRIDE